MGKDRKDFFISRTSVGISASLGFEGQDKTAVGAREEGSGADTVTGKRRSGVSAQDRFRGGLRGRPGPLAGGVGPLCSSSSTRRIRSEGLSLSTTAIWIKALSESPRQPRSRLER